MIRTESSHLIAGIGAIAWKLGKNPWWLAPAHRRREFGLFYVGSTLCARRAAIDLLLGRAVAVCDQSNADDDVLDGYLAIAGFLGVSRATAQRLAERGVLPLTRHGRKVIARRSILAAHFIELERQAQRAPCTP